MLKRAARPMTYADPRLLAGGRGGVAEDTRPALLGAQDRQCLEQAAQEPAIEGPFMVVGLYELAIRGQP
jgi:hypothetical protein